MTYYQQQNFWISIAGVYLEYFFAKGWTAPAILILKTVVDQSVQQLSVAMFLLTTNLVNTIAAYTMGYLATKYNLHPTDSPRKYGQLITILTTVPCALSAPFFLISGLKMRNLKRQKIAMGELKKENMKDDANFIKKYTMMVDNNDIGIYNIG